MSTDYSSKRLYEELYGNQRAMLEDMLKDAYANSADARSEAERIAEENRKKGIKNAYVTYDRSLNTYGQNAEALAQNGLTNSGYSDYLGGVAYSNMVGNIDSVRQTADEAFRKAAYDEEQANANARSSYNSNLIALENARAEAELAYGNNFKTAMEKAAEGGFGEFTEGNEATDVANIAKAYNISEVDAAEVYKKNVLTIEKQLAYDKNLQAVMEAAANGNYGNTSLTEENIAHFADVLNISPEDARKALEINMAYWEKKDKDGNEKRAAEFSIKKEIKGIETETGEMWFPTFDELTLAYGDYFSKEELECFADESEKNKNAYLYGVYASQLTSATTYADIDKLTDISPEYKKLLKEDLDKLVVDTEKTNFAKQGKVSIGTIPHIDDRYGADNLSKVAYQEIYFEKVLACIEGAENVNELDEIIKFIETLKNAGQIKAENASDLINYVDACKVVQISPNVPVKFKKETKEMGAGRDKYYIETYKMSFGNEEVTFYLKNTNSKKATTSISKIIPNPKEGDMVKYDNQVYVYVKSFNGGTWHAANGLKEIFDRYEKHAPASNIKPTFSTD